MPSFPEDEEVYERYHADRPSKLETAIERGYDPAEECADRVRRVGRDR